MTYFTLTLAGETYHVTPDCEGWRWQMGHDLICPPCADWWLSKMRFDADEIAELCPPVAATDLLYVPGGPHTPENPPQCQTCGRRMAVAVEGA